MAYFDIGGALPRWLPVCPSTRPSMCGRFTLKTPAAVLREMFGVSQLPGFGARYNVAPTQPVATVRRSDGVNSWEPMRWGLIPHWARDPSIGNRMINARAETIAEKPAFREPFARRRCLVPADGFYEWERIGGGRKQPWYLSLLEDQPFAFAGLWARWSGEEGSIGSCSIITTTPNELVAPIHDRMPVILDRGGFDCWLDEASTPQELRSLLHPVDARRMQARPVSTLVNSPANDDPRCLDPMAAPRPGTLFD